MLDAIVLDDDILRKALKRFKAQYPNTAAAYPSQLQTARQIVRAGGVRSAQDLNAWLVGTRSRRNALLVKDKACACGEKVCCHRLAVNLWHIGIGIAHVIASEAVIEANEVRELLAEQPNEAEQPLLGVQP